MDIEARLTNLENLVNSLIKRIDKEKYYSSADINGVRHTDKLQDDSIFNNSSDISDNRTAIEETYEESLTNAEDISDIRTAIEEVYEMITEE